MNHRIAFALKTSATPAALAMALLAAPCFAQAAAPDTSLSAAGPEIVVTGTRIARPDLKSISAVSVVSADDLKLANAATAETFLTQNPQFVAGLTSASNNGSGGTATVDLRGLGDQRTLVLIDGRRMVPYSIGGAVDINAIPSVLIKRVEVLTGGVLRQTIPDKPRSSRQRYVLTEAGIQLKLLHEQAVAKPDEENGH